MKCTWMRSLYTKFSPLQIETRIAVATHSAFQSGLQLRSLHISVNSEAPDHRLFVRLTTAGMPLQSFMDGRQQYCTPSSFSDGHATFTLAHYQWFSSRIPARRLPGASYCHRSTRASSRTMSGHLWVVPAQTRGIPHREH